MIKGFGRVNIELDLGIFVSSHLLKHRQEVDFDDQLQVIILFHNELDLHISIS